MPLAISALFVGALGAAVGSFLNVVAYRLPRRQSLVRPRSSCPGCGSAIKPYDNLPVIGWLLLRGRCRSCRTRISSRYPVVEATTAVLAAAVVVSKHAAPDIALALVLIAVLVPITLIDFEHRIIPNKITLPASVAAVIIGVCLKPSGVPAQLIAGAGCAAFLLVFAVAYPRGMGMGDVKLAGVLGLYLGAAAGVALIVGVFVATVAGVVVMTRVGVERGRKTALPFGPFLALGGLLAIFAGPAIIHWYLHLGI
jgi:leader peptidase (prepilin peptidase) / N-methyltransferase